MDNYAKRLQVYITHLLAISQHKPLPLYPQIMDPPPEAWIAVAGEDQTGADGQIWTKEMRIEAMRDGYKSLREAWPEYVPGMRPSPGGKPQQPGQQQGGAQNNAQLQSQAQAQARARAQMQARAQQAAQAQSQA